MGALILAAVLHAAPDPDLLARAQTEEREGLRLHAEPAQAHAHFREAAAAYEALYREGHRSAACLQNEGNAALLAGDLPRSILAYRRGLRFAPNDPVLRANLAYARDQVAYPAPVALGRPAADNWPPILPRPTPRGLVPVAFLAYAAGLAALTRWRMTRRPAWLTGSAAAILLALTAALGLGWLRLQEERNRAHPLVIVAADGVVLRNGNGLAYPARHDGVPLNRGVEARVLAERDGLAERDSWFLIELDGGETGWVRSDQVLGDAS